MCLTVVEAPLAPPHGLFKVLGAIMKPLASLHLPYWKVRTLSPNRFARVLPHCRTLLVQQPHESIDYAQHLVLLVQTPQEIIDCAQHLALLVQPPEESNDHAQPCAPWGWGTWEDGSLGKDPGCFKNQSFYRTLS